MRHRFLASMGVLVVVIAVVSLAPAPVAAQAPSAAKTKTPATGKTWTPPHTPDGQPDLQGVWDYRTVTPLERPSELAGKQVLTDEEAAEFEQREAQRRDARSPEDPGRNTVHPVWWLDYGKKVIESKRTSLIVNPPDGRVPALTPEVQKREAALAAATQRPSAGPEDRSLMERCIVRALPTLPGAYNNNIQIFQSRDTVVIVNEMIHEVRVVPMDGRPHLGQNIRQWLGDARGHWEGNALVIDTTNFSEGNFRGSRENLHLEERFTRVDADTVNYEVSVDDATTFTKPWTVSIPMAKSADRIYEYACHEGNYAMVGILGGARAQEKAAEEAAKKGSR